MVLGTAERAAAHQRPAGLDALIDGLAHSMLFLTGFNWHVRCILCFPACHPDCSARPACCDIACCACARGGVMSLQVQVRGVAVFTFFQSVCI